MGFNEIIKYLAENLNIELESGHTGELNNQTVRVRLKLDGTIISSSDCEVLINEVK